MAMVFAAMMMVASFSAKGWGPGDCYTAIIHCDGKPTGYAIVCGFTQQEREEMYKTWQKMMCIIGHDEESVDIIQTPAP